MLTEEELGWVAVLGAEGRAPPRATAFGLWVKIRFLTLKLFGGE